MGHCPYSDEELQEWDSVTNPMGSACDDCPNLDCEHNPNPGTDYDGPDLDSDYVQDDSYPEDDDSPEEEGDNNATIIQRDNGP